MRVPHLPSDIGCMRVTLVTLVMHSIWKPWERTDEHMWRPVRDARDALGRVAAKQRSGMGVKMVTVGTCEFAYLSQKRVVIYSMLFSRNASASSTDIRFGNGVSDNFEHFLISNKLRVCCSLLQNPWLGNLLPYLFSPQQLLDLMCAFCQSPQIKSILCSSTSQMAHVIFLFAPAHVSHGSQFVLW